LLLGLGLGVFSKWQAVGLFGSPRPGFTIGVFILAAVFAILTAVERSKLWVFFAATFMGVGISWVI
jgi:hypothetical protein